MPSWFKTALRAVSSFVQSEFGQTVMRAAARAMIDSYQRSKQGGGRTRIPVDIQDSAGTIPRRQFKRGGD